MYVFTDKHEFNSTYLNNKHQGSLKDVPRFIQDMAAASVIPKINEKYATTLYSKLQQSVSLNGSLITRNYFAIVKGALQSFTLVACAGHERGRGGGAFQPYTGSRSLTWL